MSKPREIWWSYAKAMIRQYPRISQAAGAPCQLSATKQKELDAVNQAIEITAQKINGKDRLAVIDYLFYQQGFTLDQAATRLYISEGTARRYHRDFVRLVGECYGLTK